MNNIGTCRGCGRQIVWIRTKSGKNMPCDPNFKYYKRDGKKERIVTVHGEVVSCTIVDCHEGSDGYGYIPHWSTCTAVGNFKKIGGER